MPDSPPRKRFQIHLSTAIVLMFVAGALIWANVRPQIYTLESFEMSSGEYQRIDWGYGWPIVYPTETDYVLFKNGDRYGDPAPRAGLYFSWNMGINALITFIILLTVWYLCEWWIIRRRTSRKDA